MKQFQDGVPAGYRAAAVKRNRAVINWLHVIFLTSEYQLWKNSYLQLFSRFSAGTIFSSLIGASLILALKLEFILPSESLN